MSQAYVPAAAQRARLAKALSLQYYSVCEALPKGEKQNFAAAGNRTRVARVAGEHHTTRPRLRKFMLTVSARRPGSEEALRSSCGTSQAEVKRQILNK